MQAEWFAKKGLAWHVSVIQTLVHIDGVPKVQNDYYVCILDKQFKQDADKVGAITLKVLKDYKAKNPGITEFYLRSDQAGCYKTANLLIPLWSLNQGGELGDAKIKEYIYSEAGSGKSLCDQVNFLPMTIACPSLNQILFSGLRHYQEPNQKSHQFKERCNNCPGDG